MRSLLLALRVISVRCGIWSLSEHSGLWQAIRPADLWVHGLNQDTLLEQQYIPLAGQDAFLQSFQSPGYIAAYRPEIVRALDSSTYGGLADRIELHKPDQSLTLLPHLQPYIKLHGSISI